MKAIDAIPIHLRERLGTRKIPLSYVIRDNIVPPALSPLCTDCITSAAFTSIMEELIQFAPHHGPEYDEDNARVFQVIQDLVAGTSHKVSIKAHRRRRDGRAAYLSLVMHNIG
mmetsp:Transcript_10523/g.14855  ORF Transcript_10523/g.14855 Transcript_10523/m.14855 type:complete len:113 (+) Transcript_10523:416-754(+)